MIVASIKGILEDDGILLDCALAYVEYLPTESVNEVLARVWGYFLHPKSLAGNIGELLLDYTRSIVFRLLLDGEGLSGGSQSEADLSEVSLDCPELLVGSCVVFVEDKLSLWTLGHVQYQFMVVFGAERDISFKQQRLLWLHRIDVKLIYMAFFKW